MAILLCMLLSPLLAIYSGYVFGIVWGWFIVPTFGLPPLNIPQAIGLGMLVSFMTYFYVHVEDDSRSTGEKATFSIVASLFKTSGLWLFAWIVHLFL